MTQPGKCPASTTPRMGEPPTCRGPGAPMGVGMLRIPETQPPTPGPVPATVSDGRTLRYFTYSAGFTHSGVSRNPWSQSFGWRGYCTYPSHTCKTRPLPAGPDPNGTAMHAPGWFRPPNGPATGHSKFRCGKSVPLRRDENPTHCPQLWCCHPVYLLQYYCCKQEGR